MKKKLINLTYYPEMISQDDTTEERDRAIIEDMMEKSIDELGKIITEDLQNVIANE